MIFIGGISQKLNIIDDNPVICPVCGLKQAYYKRLDTYLNIFFIPVLRIKKGEPFLMCERCERSINEMAEEYYASEDEKQGACRGCGRRLDPEFSYCPFCGKRR